jgi:hypothetical protein
LPSGPAAVWGFKTSTWKKNISPKEKKVNINFFLEKTSFVNKNTSRKKKRQYQKKTFEIFFVNDETSLVCGNQEIKDFL